MQKDNALNRISSTMALTGTKLCKQYPGKGKVLTDLDIELEEGALYALLGPNGAGKSTLIGILTGIYKPDKGAVKVLGFNPAKDPLEVKRRIGIVPEELALFERLTGMQQLMFSGRMYGLTAKETKRRADELLSLTELSAAGSQLIATYSKGMRRRLAIATALIHRPSLVFLDEPFDGIDIIAAQVIRALLEELRRQGVTILLTTHILEIADRLATHAGVLYKGKILDHDEKDKLLARYGCDDLEGVFQSLVPIADISKATLSFYQEDSTA
ncbi:MAG: ABC transporter ATP-binding protein [Pseudomonadales bacterium]|nr:ABC transporter ATP-binding protein [Pseudomonadales bacterium]